MRRQTGIDLNLEGFDLDHISFDGRVVYRNPFAGARLSEDDLGVAMLLERTGAWARGEGPEPYPLAEGLQDHLISLAIERVDRLRARCDHDGRGLGGLTLRRAHAPAPHRGDERDARAVGEVDVARGVEQDGVGAGARRRGGRCRCGAALARRPAVAAQTASSGVMPISRTAIAMQNGMFVV